MGKKYGNGKVNPKRMVCVSCLQGKCGQCVDMVLILAGRPQICLCKKPGHSGEPRDKQISDPETGTVYGPEMFATREGNVVFRGTHL